MPVQPVQAAPGVTTGLLMLAELDVIGRGVALSMDTTDVLIAAEFWARAAGKAANRIAAELVLKEDMFTIDCYQELCV